MSKPLIDTQLVDKAVKFAVDAHAGQERRGHGFPYVVHPLEAVSIVATITPDPEMLAAAALHDVVEDCGVTFEQLEQEFGPRVAHLVDNESEKEMEGAASDTWHARKQAAIDRIARADHDSKIVAMGDKLSNMRAIARDFAAEGESFWSKFHVTDPLEHEWHYRGLAESLKELEGTEAYAEFVGLIDKTFTNARPFSLKQEDGTIIVSGPLTCDNIGSVVKAIEAAGSCQLDFENVSSVQFAAMRGLLSARANGAEFCIVNANANVAQQLSESGVTRFISVLRAADPYDITTADEFGGGYTAKSYWTADGDGMVKLYEPFVPVGEPEREVRYSCGVLAMGIPTPLAGGLIKVGDRNGVLFERVKGKKSLSRLIADDPDNIRTYVCELAKMAKLLHSTPCDKAVFPSQIGRLREITDELTCFDDAQKAAIHKVIDEIEPEEVCCHGDLHIGNVILTPAGDALLIDLPDFCYGNHLMDLGALYFACHYIDDAMADDLYHVTPETMAQVWQIFAEEYFGAKTPEQMAALDETMRPYAGLQALPWCRHGVGEDLMRVINANIINR